jgi:hypothetical protein
MEKSIIADIRVYPFPINPDYFLLGSETLDVYIKFPISMKDSMESLITEWKACPDTSRESEPEDGRKDVRDLLEREGFFVPQGTPCVPGPSQRRIPLFTKGFIPFFYSFSALSTLPCAVLALRSVSLGDVVRHFAERPVLPLPLMLPVLVLSFLLHEWAHTQQAAYFGLRTRRLHFRLKLFSQSNLSVQIPGLYTLPRVRKNLVSFAGVCMHLFLGNAFFLVFSFLPESLAATTSFCAATVNYIMFLANLNPFMATDGYHMLSIGMFHEVDVKRSIYRKLRRKARWKTGEAVFAVCYMVYLSAFLVLATWVANGTIRLLLRPMVLPETPWGALLPWLLAVFEGIGLFLLVRKEYRNANK